MQRGARIAPAFGLTAFQIFPDLHLCLFWLIHCPARLRKAMNLQVRCSGLAVFDAIQIYRLMYGAQSQIHG